MKTETEKTVEETREKIIDDFHVQLGDMANEAQRKFRLSLFREALKRIISDMDKYAAEQKGRG